MFHKVGLSNYQVVNNRKIYKVWLLAHYTMIQTLSPEAVRNLEMLREFFEVPENCSDPQTFLRNRRALATRLYEATGGQSEVVPANAVPAEYDPVTHFRTSPDIQRFKGSDGVWYHASGIRDEARSPKEDLSKYLYNKD